MGAAGLVRAALAAHEGPQSAWLVGEPCFPPPEVLREALVRAARAPRFDYPPLAGLPLLREILATRSHQLSATDPGEIGGPATRHQGPFSPVGADQVVVTSGAKAGLLAVLAAILGPGDELIHPLPCYPAYPAMAARIGARPVGVPESNGSFEGWAERVGEAIGPRTRAVVLSSPSNPTGATLDPAQARALVELCRDRGVRLVSDEAYADFPLRPDRDGQPAEFDRRHETVVQVRSVSKSWALCGWRIGWVVADAPLAARVAEVHAGLTNPASGPAQEALLALPEVPESYTADARDTVAERLSEVGAVLEAGGFTVARPEGGFYLWLDVRSRVGEHQARMSHQVLSRGRRGGVPSEVSDPRGAESYSTVRRARRGEKTPPGAIHRRPQQGAGETCGLDGIVAPWCVELAGKYGVGLWPGEDFQGDGRVRIAVTAPADEDWERSLDALARAVQPPA